MLTIKTKKLEKAFNIKIIPFITCLGVDTASRTGWCVVSTDPDNVIFKYDFIDVKSKDILARYNYYIEFFSNLPKCPIVRIEEAHLKFYRGKGAVKSFQKLSRFGMIIYTVNHLKGVKDKKFITASHARKMLDFKGNDKKEIIHKQFIKKLNLKLTDQDIIDAMILSINGVINEKQT